MREVRESLAPDAIEEVMEIDVQQHRRERRPLGDALAGFRSDDALQQLHQLATSNMLSIRKQTLGSFQF